MAYKTSLFQHKILRKEPDKNQFIIFKNMLNDLLREYDDHCKELVKEFQKTNIKDIPSSMVIKNMPYSSIKNFIYPSYDFASILKFVQGVEMGASDDKMKDHSDVQDFFEQTVRLAFKLDADDVGELVETYLAHTEDDLVEMDNTERNMFDSVRNYNELFRPADRSVIYTSILEALHYLNGLEGPLRGEYNLLGDDRMMIALINQTIEYVIYTVMVYLIRIFMIYNYLRPVEVKIAQMKPLTPVAVSEATEEPEEMEGCFEPLRKIDHTVIRDPHRLVEYITVLHDFLTWLNVKDLNKLPKPGQEYINPETMANNLLYGGIINLQDNPLFQTIVCYKQKYDDDRSQVNDKLNIAELHQQLKYGVDNPKQALPGASPKDGFLHAIRGVGGKDASKLKETIAHLYTFTVHFSSKLHHMMDDVKGQYDQSHVIDGTKFDPHGIHTLTDKRLLNEIYNYLLQFYQDFIFAVYRKFLYLENEYCKSKDRETNKIYQMTSLDNVLNDAMQVAVPSTLRMPIEYQDQFVIPVFEYLEMYDEYLRHLPEFQNDPYLTEAANLSSIINAIWALLQGIYNSSMAFFKNFRPAAKWVTANEQKLLSMKLPEGEKIEALPYKISVARFKQCVEGIIKTKGEVDKDTLKDEASLKAFVEKLYPKITSAGVNLNLYDEITNKNTTFAKVYNNYLLFGKNTPEEVAKVAVTKDNYTPYLKGWIASVKGADEIVQEITKLKVDIDGVARDLKSKMTTLVKESTIFIEAEAAPPPTQADAKPAAPGSAASTTSKPDNAEQPKADDTQAKGEEKKTDKPEGKSYADLCARVNNAITNLWSPINKELTKAMRNEYGYIKDFYSKASKAQVQTQPAKPTESKPAATAV